MKKKNLPLYMLEKKDIKNIKLIVFDVDGVLVPRGTKIKQKGNVTTLETKVIPKSHIEQIKKLHKFGYIININSGRGLYMLEEMFRPVLNFVSLTYENGSATWYRGKLYQHVNSFDALKKILPELKVVKDSKIKGFEPKEFIITIHCKSRVKKIENIVKKYRKLYTVWNGEAYDISIKNKQTKVVGLKAFMKILKLKKKSVLAVGDNFNDKELLSTAGISVTADKKKVKGNFYTPLNKKNLPAGQLMQRIIDLY